MTLDTRDVTADSEVAAMEYAWAEGWTDGLPIIPPTPERVTAFLEYAGLDPDQEIGQYAVRNRGITAAKIASNAVMAGCRPEYMPVVVAAIEAITEPDFKMNHLASTSSPWPVFIVNGPIIKELGLNSGAYVLGPGSRPNATIGRAISLTLANCMDAKVGGVQQGIMGIPARAAGQVIAENEDISWEPLSVMRGFPRGVSTLTAATHYMAGPRQVIALPEHLPKENVALALANMLSEYCGEGSLTSVQTVLLSPSFQRAFASEGWSRKDVRDYLVENVKASVASLKLRHRWLAETWEEPLVHSSAPIYPGDESKFVYHGKGEDFGRKIGGHAATHPRKEMDYIIAVAGSDIGQMYACFFRPYIPDGANTKVIRPPANRG